MTRLADALPAGEFVAETAAHPGPHGVIVHEVVISGFHSEDVRATQVSNGTAGAGTAANEV
jgi:hypothetical protein